MEFTTDIIGGDKLVCSQQKIHTPGFKRKLEKHLAATLCYLLYLRQRVIE